MAERKEMKTRNEILDYAVMLETNRFVTDQSQKTAKFLREVAEQIFYYEEALKKIQQLSNIAIPKN